MRWKPGNVSDIVLLLLTIFSLVLYFMEERTLKQRKVRDFDIKFKASIIMRRGMEAIKEERLKLGIPIDPVNDPDSTGIIGHQISPITYGIADLSAKLTSLNPNLAALFLEYLKKLKLKPKDTVAVALTGSYPALNIALYSAMKIMDIYPLIITQVSSDMWGANDPELTWLDMESILVNKGITPYKSIAATVGGEDDLGRGLTREGIELIKKAAERNGVRILKPTTSNIIQLRINAYGNHKIKAYIVLGENRIASSTSPLPQGIITKRKLRFPEGEGVAIQFLKRGIPVLHISNIEKVAKSCGLPLSPHPIPEPGSGSLFYKKRYSAKLAGILALILAILLFAFIRFDLAEFLRRQRSGL